MAKLRFYHGLMGAGKSTLALQVADNFRRAGQVVDCFTGPSRTPGVITSRLGVDTCAGQFDESTNFFDEYRAIDSRWIVDEAQFLTERQVEELLDVARLGVAVDCFGLKTDFTAHLFPGSKRLIEIADEVHEIQVPAMCWCGASGGVNARIVDGRVATSGPQLLVGGGVTYRVLCYEHYLNGEVAPC